MSALMLLVGALKNPKTAHGNYMERCAYNPSYKGIKFTQFGKFSEYFRHHPQADIELQNLSP